MMLSASIHVRLSESGTWACPRGKEVKMDYPAAINLLLVWMIVQTMRQ